MFNNKKSKFKLGEQVSVINPKELYLSAGRRLVVSHNIYGALCPKELIGEVQKITPHEQGFLYQIKGGHFLYDQKNLKSVDLKRKINKLLKK